MEQNNEEMQMIAVEKVLEEMQETEKNLMKWNAYWWESYDNIVVPTEYLYNYYDLNDARKCGEFFGESTYIYNLRTDKPLGMPLKRFVSNPVYNQDICTIKWTGIETNNSSRKIIFNNAGEISLEKHAKKKPKKQSKTIEYEANYNVLSDNFSINATVTGSLIPGVVDRYNYGELSISLKKNLLTSRYNDIEIVQDLNTGVKIVKISKKYDKRNRNNNASVIFEAVLNSDDSLETGAVAINTHKGNGKVNGTYRFDVSRKKGIRANFYSRKGVKIDLTTNPMLLGTANTLLLPSSKSNTSSGLIVSNFATSTQKTIAKNLTEKVISFDNSDFNMESVKQAESRMLEMLKCIKGELPLPGLVERIDSCLSLIDSEKQEKLEGKTKVLKLESNN